MPVTRNWLIEAGTNRDAELSGHKIDDCHDLRCQLTDRRLVFCRPVADVSEIGRLNGARDGVGYNQPRFSPKGRRTSPLPPLVMVCTPFTGR